MRTLLIEDEIMARTVGASLVESLGCQCDSTDTGEKALELIKKNAYDFILCDLGLPGITGFEVARQIRKGNTVNKDIPIFALTAHDDENYEEKVKKSGMTHLLAKPLGETTFKGVLSCVAAKTC